MNGSAAFDSAVTRASVFIAAAALALAGAGPAAGHDTLVIGMDAANRLEIHMHVDELPIPLPESPYPGVAGYASVDPGLEALNEDDPARGLYVIPPDSNIEVVVAGLGGAFLWNQDGTAPLPIGGSYHLGMPYFHFHPVWSVPDGVVGEIYTVDIFVRDLTGHLKDSAIVSVPFGPVPEPVTAVGMLAGLLAALRRRAGSH